MADENPTPEIVTPSDISKRPTRPAILWASAALIAVSAAVLVGQTEKGAQRLQVALGYASQPSRILAQLELPRLTFDKGASDKAHGNAETMRLAAAVRELSADRDRLKSRIASLEQTLDDTTGSIKKQVEEVAAAQSAAKEQAAPVPSAPATAAVTMPSMTLPPSGPVLSPWPHQRVQEASVPTPLPAPALQPPTHVASLPVESEKPASRPPAKREFGADLGSAASMESLRTHWSAVKANYGPLLKGLQPRYFAHESKPGVIEYHLILGPFTTAAAANGLCGRLTATRIYCRTAMFEGDRLATQ